MHTGTVMPLVFALSELLAFVAALLPLRPGFARAPHHAAVQLSVGLVLLPWAALGLSLGLALFGLPTPAGARLLLSAAPLLAPLPAVLGLVLALRSGHLQGAALALAALILGGLAFIAFPRV